jgi:signal transduction histidine kinase
LNIIRNAEEAMPDGGQIVIQTVNKVNSVELCISDTGCGIPEAHLNRLFDSFFTTKGGMGLGLAVSHEIIRAAGGNIEVESTVGKGTTFRIELPACYTSSTA